MRKIRILLAGVLAAMPLALVTASPAQACRMDPCHAACHFNPPVYVEGDQVYFSDRDLFECYY